MKLSAYKIQETIHQSPNTVIHKCLNTQDHQYYILKMINDTHPDEDSVNMLRHEYDLLVELEEKAQISSGIPKAVAFINEDRGCAIVFHDTGARSLKHLEISLSTGEMIEIFIALTEVLLKIHKYGLVHRDINPSNILWSRSSHEITLIDFGLAAPSKEERDTHTIEGTLQYISPEQSGRMNHGVDHRSDIYSFGATMYALITGQLLFPEYTDPLDLIHHHLTIKPSDPHDLNGSVPKSLSDIVMKCLSKNRNDRYQSVISLRDDLIKSAAMLEKNNLIGTFKLGENDILFKVPDKLYGISEEYAALRQVLENPPLTRPSLVVVSGPSGSGKTYMINTIRSEINTFNISGKCEQYRQSIPYHVLVLCFKNFIHKIAAKGEREVHVWKAHFQEALGSRISVLKLYVPEVTLITGDIQPAPELPPMESKTRLKIVISDLLNCIARYVEKLVLFIDDIQWIDNDSIDLLEYCVENSKVSSFTLLCAYRNENAVDQHSLFRLQKSFEDNDCPLTHIHIKPLTSEDVGQLIQDIFKGQLKNTESLIENLDNLTKGNPLFTITLLEYYHSTGVLAPISGGHAWDYAPERFSVNINQSDIIKFMTSYIKRLPLIVQKHLQVGALIGSSFTISRVALISSDSIALITESITTAKDHNLIVSDAFSQDRFHFTHDQIQQTASLLNISNPTQLHYKIGNMLLEQYENSPSSEILFDIANHYNAAKIHLEKDKRLFILRDINYQAASVALRVSAFNMAYTYISKAIAQDPQAHHYVFGAECAMLCGHYDVMNTWIGEARSRLHNPLDQIPIGLTEINSFIARSDYSTAVDKGRLLLEQLGYDFPLFISKARILKELLLTQHILPRKHYNAFKNLAPVSDPVIGGVLEVLSSILSACYLTDANLFLFVVLKQIQLAAKHGLSPTTGIALSNYSLILCAVLKKYDDGNVLGEIALDISAATQDASALSRTKTHLALFTLHWKNPLILGRETFREAYKLALESGDLEYMAWSIFGYAEYTYFMGMPLKKSIHDLNEAMEVCKRTGQQKQYSFSEIFSEAALFLTKDNMPYLSTTSDDPSTLFYTHFHTMIHAYMLHDTSAAIHHAEKTFDYIEAVISTMCNPISYFFNCLVLIQKNRLNHTEHRQLIKHLNQLKKWAQNAPGSCSLLYKLAQTAYDGFIRHKQNQLHNFEAAIALSKEYGALHYEALAHELASLYSHNRNMAFISKQHMNQAYYLYKKWGALRKLQQMNRDYQSILSLVPTSKPFYEDTTYSFTEGQSIDINSLIKTTQSLSEQMEFNGLMNAFNEHIIKNAGATLGALFIECNKTICLKSRWSIKDNKSISSKQFEEGGTIDTVRKDFPKMLPYDFITYAWRINQIVLFKRGAREEAYADDPYFEKYPTDSVMAIPILLKGKSIGLLYLENSVTDAVFSQDRLAAIQVIVGQLAISYENARLYEEMENKIRERTEQLYALTDEYYELSIHDQLTQLYNRRKLDEVLKREVSRLNRTSDPLSVIILDIDNFKMVNDTYGHLAGDDVLIKMASLLKHAIRSTDVIGRWGGEEFLIICSNTLGDNAVYLAEKLRLLIENTDFGLGRTITSSFGVAAVEGLSDASLLLNQADRALYAAKNQGRNRVICSCDM